MSRARVAALISSGSGMAPTIAVISSHSVSVPVSECTWSTRRPNNSDPAVPGSVAAVSGSSPRTAAVVRSR
jgi:hypothetical protein